MESVCFSQNALNHTYGAIKFINFPWVTPLDSYSTTVTSNSTVSGTCPIVHSGADFCVQNELKPTSGHLKVQNLSRGYTPGPTRGGEREGEEIGEGDGRREGKRELNVLPILNTNRRPLLITFALQCTSGEKK